MGGESGTIACLRNQSAHQVELRETETEVAGQGHLETCVGSLEAGPHLPVRSTFLL